MMALMDRATAEQSLRDFLILASIDVAAIEDDESVETSVAS